jgi:hypothetical protein
MSRAILALAKAAGLIALSLSSVDAAELVPPVSTSQVQTDCDRCGCLSAAYDYHRELLSSYGLSFDPRSYDTTEPHFYFGRVRAYPRYFVEGAGSDGC